MLTFTIEEIETLGHFNNKFDTFLIHMRTETHPRIVLLPNTGYSPFDEYVVREWQTYINLQSYYIPSNHYSEKEYILDAFNDFLETFRKMIADKDILTKVVNHFRKKNEYNEDWTREHLSYMEANDLYLNEDNIIETVEDLDSQWKRAYRKFKIDSL